MSKQNRDKIKKLREEIKQTIKDKQEALKEPDGP